jgi:hypothetical protein
MKSFIFPDTVKKLIRKNKSGLYRNERKITLFGLQSCFLNMQVVDELCLYAPILALTSAKYRTNMTSECCYIYGECF